MSSPLTKGEGDSRLPPWKSPWGLFLISYMGSITTYMFYLGAKSLKKYLKNFSHRGILRSISFYDNLKSFQSIFLVFGMRIERDEPYQMVEKIDEITPLLLSKLGGMSLKIQKKCQKPVKLHEQISFLK